MFIDKNHFFDNDLFRNYLIIQTIIRTLLLSILVVNSQIYTLYPKSIHDEDYF
jgi:hypothetical protein